jgi:hypothetical protein
LPIGLHPGTVICEDPLQLVQRHLSEHRTCLSSDFLILAVAYYFRPSWFVGKTEFSQRFWLGY